FSSRRLHTRSKRDWSSDVCSSDLQSFLTKCKSAGQQQETGVANHAVLWSYSKTIQMPAALYSFGGVCRRETAVITDRFVEARWFGRGGHIVDPHAIGRQ